MELTTTHHIQQEQADTTEIVLYHPNAETNLEVRIANDTVWLSQSQMAELFGTQRQAITKHLKKIFDTKELERSATSSVLELLRQEGNRMVTRTVELFNLDVIISVGFRVNTTRGIQFRQWANQVLKDYLLRGYSINNRLTLLEHQVEKRLARTEIEIEKLNDKMEFYVKPVLANKQGIFFDGQIFDAYIFVAELIKKAKRNIILIDNYVDESVLTLLDKRESGVKAVIYTQGISAQLKLDIDRHNIQYPPIDVRVFKQSHDRFLCIDKTVYHIGASIKDLGKKWFAFSILEDTTPAYLVDRIMALNI